MGAGLKKIRQVTEDSLSGYFVKMSSGEFEGANIFPENSQTMVAVFLAASSNEYSLDEIADAFKDVMTRDEVADAYARAYHFIGKDPHLAMSVLGVARDLDIPEENISIS